MNSDARGPIEAARRTARRLIKDLRSRDADRVRSASERFRRLRSFRELDPADSTLRQRAQLKHALAVVAEEHGHPSWLAFKRSAQAPASGVPAVPDFYGHCLAGFLFRWFVDPAEAATSRREHGGFVLPFKGQCFVCEAEAVRELGLDPDDPDWEAVGFDLVRPADEAACKRLFQKRRAAIQAGVGVPVQRPTC